MLKEVYFIIVSRINDRQPIEFDHYPTEEEIIRAIKDCNGITARVEKGYKLIG